MGMRLWLGTLSLLIFPVLNFANDAAVDPSLVGFCDPGIILSAEERTKLLNKLRISKAGRDVLADFTAQYGSLSKLLIQWDSVSYSQVAKTSERAPASATVSGR